MEKPAESPPCPTLKGLQETVNNDYDFTPTSEEQWETFERQTRCLGGVACTGPSRRYMRPVCSNVVAATDEFARRQANPTPKTEG